MVIILAMFDVIYINPKHYFTEKAVKICTANGTWFAKGGHEWTDYTSCLDKQVCLIPIYIQY